MRVIMGLGASANANKEEGSKEHLVNQGDKGVGSPFNKKKKNEKSMPKESSRKDEDTTENDSETENSVSDMKKKKKKNKKKVDKKRSKAKKHHKANITADSMYDYSDASLSTDSSDSLSISDSDYNVKDFRFVTQVPKVEPFANRRGQDVHRFFKEYENYCSQCFQGRKNLWITGLQESLEEGMLDSFRAMTADAGIKMKYEIIKSRLIKQAERMKRTAHHDQRNSFDRIKIRTSESLWAYALRLETAAIEKFGEDILEQDDKEIFKKFLDTVPDSIRIQVNKQRKLRKRLGAKRYSWNDLRQDLEEETFTTSERKTADESEVRLGTEGSPVYDSYKDALIAGQKNQKTDLYFMVKASYDETKKQTDLLRQLVEERGRTNKGETRSRGTSQNRSQSRNREHSQGNDRNSQGQRSVVIATEQAMNGSSVEQG